MDIFLFAVLGIALATTFVLGTIDKDDNTDMSYLEDC